MADLTTFQSINAKQLADKDRVLSLFRFIQELNKLKRSSTLNINDKTYSWAYPLSDLPDNPACITVRYRDSVETEGTDNTPALLSVRKPVFTKCPQPNSIFTDWLEDGWDNYRNAKVAVKDYLQAPDGGDDEAFPEFFDDDQERVIAFDNWLKHRDLWVNEQLIAKKTLDLFSKLYSMYFELLKDSETKEIIVANGMLADRNDPQIRHPLLTKRVKLSFDADNNVVSIEDTEAPSELYTVIFQSMQGINQSAINGANAQLQENDYHPLDRNETSAFLKAFANELSSDSVFCEGKAPDKWYGEGRLMISMEPYYIVRKRLDGTVKAIEQIIENVQQTNEIPAPIIDIVSGGIKDVQDELEEETLEEQLAAVGGESVDILLSKEANREQLEIAKRIEKNNAVLVQGPPGTGKTHTIANLLGHFLAQGKSVLVTCYTTKALRVLKEKVAPGLQDLCVSLLDDSNEEMERSISGIAEKMSSTNSRALKKEMDSLAVERRKVIDDLARVRRDIFAVINKECECIVFNGESISPSDAADFVSRHINDLSYISDNVPLNTPLPLPIEQLSCLYRSNGAVSGTDEAELGFDIPDPNEVLSPVVFSSLLDDRSVAEAKISEAAYALNWQIENDYATKTVQFNCPYTSFTIPYPNQADLKELKDFASVFGQIEEWMQYAAVDGRKGGSFRQRWITLADQIRQTCDLTELTTGEQFGIKLDIKSDDLSWLADVFEKLRTVFFEKGKLGKLTLKLHKDFERALSQATINGQPVKSAGECDIVLNEIELRKSRNQCARYWDELMHTHGVPAFYDLDSVQPEQLASKWVPAINRCLDWYQRDYQKLVELLSKNRIPAGVVFSKSTNDTDLAVIAKVYDSAERIIPRLCDVGSAVLKINDINKRIDGIKQILTIGHRSNSIICNCLYNALQSKNVAAYKDAFTELQHMYDKYDLLRKRNEWLAELKAVAPNWADDIRCRRGIHGSPEMPATIADAWKWSQLNGEIMRITAQSFAKLQDESRRLSREYRRITAEYAEKSGWYHLLKRTELDLNIKQALIGWKQTIMSIGKGTGKRAPLLKAEARKLMSKCQDAVPAWIMPMTRAMDSLDPKKNRFDVIIIDEASQSDISSMAILYMGKKLIIVGDDQQVSPMAVGMDVDKMTNLIDMYLTDRIPNAHLYTAKDSIYKVAETTFPSLMLKEHFRCVPEIIGFSNMLSYDYKIKPLRDASDSVLLPAVVNYRVENGFRYGDQNEAEAKAVVALMRACISQPEYAGKSFGVISLLGDEQAALIEKLIIDGISPKEIKERKILCGNSANFQGDERDVVFLSMVDSGDGNGPLTLREYGQDEANRKRYNVAASRARDQLWVVHSLDASTDLKPGDIRKRLLDYSRDPQSFAQQHAEIEARSESPFEAEVAQALSDKGYHLVQQWPVGAYRLDLVAVCGKKTVAIECDGERWHSGEEKIREDMERQTILERLGWRFIRIRGSEYYRNKTDSISRVDGELRKYDIYPEDSGALATYDRNTELLGRVKECAARIMREQKSGLIESIEATIGAALDGHENQQEEPLHGTEIGNDLGENSGAYNLTQSESPASANEPNMENYCFETKDKAEHVEENGSKHLPNGKSAKESPRPWPHQPKENDKGKSSTIQGVVHLGEKFRNGKKEESKRIGKEIVWRNGQEEATTQESTPSTTNSAKSPTHKKDKKQRPTAVNHTLVSEFTTATKEPDKSEQVVAMQVDDKSDGEFELLLFLKKNNIPYVDNRSKRGFLWLIGGLELKPIAIECSRMGYSFKFRKNGTKPTNNQPCWQLERWPKK